MNVSVRFEFDSAEHYRATRAVTSRTAWRWVPVVVGGWLLLVIAGSVWFAQRTGHALGPLLVSLAPWVALILLWLIAIPAGQRWASSRVGQKDRSLEGPQERTVDEAGYHSNGNGVRLDVPWHIVYSVTETTEFLLFFYNKQCAYYIPKRAMSPEQITRARELARLGAGVERTKFLAPAG